MPRLTTFDFFYHKIKDNDRNLCQDLLTIENTDLKVHALHDANELLIRVRLPFKNFRKLAQHAETIQKMFGERVMTRTRCQ